MPLGVSAVCCENLNSASFFDGKMHLYSPVVYEKYLADCGSSVNILWIFECGNKNKICFGGIIPYPFGATRHSNALSLFGTKLLGNGPLVVKLFTN